MIDYQTLLALLIVAWAVGFVAWRVLGGWLGSKASGCGSCGTCPSAGVKSSPPAVFELRAPARSSQSD